jgi:hypothetical protein
MLRTPHGSDPKQGEKLTLGGKRAVFSFLLLLASAIALVVLIRFFIL